MTPASTTDRIHKEITLRAPRARIWRALTDAGEFGAWFGVELDSGFQAGQTVRGRITSPGCESLRFEATVEWLRPEESFAFRWSPCGDGTQPAAADAPSTLVEFRLDGVDGAVRLTVTESGFDTLPADQRRELFARNEGGWAIQVENFRRHVDG